MPDGELGSIPPEAKRALVRFGLPVVVAAFSGMAIGAYGDNHESVPLIVLGVGVFLIAFVVWAIVVTRLLAKPDVKAWGRAMERGPSANKFNTLVCSCLVIFGLVQFAQGPSGFSVVFLLGSVGMLVVFIYRGWFSKPGSDDQS